MAKTKKYKEMVNLSAQELVTKINEIQGQLFQLRMKKVTGQLEDVSSLWRTRKELARLKTRQSQQAHQSQTESK